MGELEKVCSRDGVPVEMIIRTGHPVDEIIKTARKTKVGLIVVGSHGKGILKSAVLGSVSYGVVQNAPGIPVLVYRK